jgi:hypothetical protein
MPSLYHCIKEASLNDDVKIVELPVQKDGVPWMSGYFATARIVTGLLVMTVPQFVSQETV